MEGILKNLELLFLATTVILVWNFVLDHQRILGVMDILAFFLRFLWFCEEDILEREKMVVRG